MPKRKCACQGGDDLKARGGKYCSQCGEVINPESHITLNCPDFHRQRKESLKWKYCVDCGVEL